MLCFESLKVVDAATLFVGPLAAQKFAGYGVDVVKIKHPKYEDPARRHGPTKVGVGLGWKQLARNKRAIAVDLSTDDGREVGIYLLKDTDVFIEDFRPRTLERWGFRPEILHNLNPRLVIARVTGFGQFGPKSGEPGFGPLAETMVDFASMTGQADGPPPLPPLALADGIAGIATIFAAMAALRSRDETGRGQVIDLAIIEAILAVLGPQITAYKALGIVPQRNGNRSDKNASRNNYRTRDHGWVAVSTSAQTVAERVMALVGRTDLVKEDWVSSGYGRAANVEELDEAVWSWIAQRRAEDFLHAFSLANAVVAPVYEVRDIVEDAHYKALETKVEVPDEELGSVYLQNVVCRQSETPGEIRWAGASIGKHTNEVLTDLGFSKTRVGSMRAAGARR